MFFDDHEMIELITIPPLALLLAIFLVILAAPPRAAAVPPTPARWAGAPQFVLALTAGGR